MNTRKFIKCIAMALIAVCCAAAPAQQAAGEKDKDEARFPSVGVRFVICSATGEKLPTPLYAKVKNDYLPIHITPRMPSPRITPIKGKIALYTEPPTKKQEKDARPYLEISVPKEHQSRSICVVMTGKESDEGSGTPKNIFLNEADFAKGGTYVVNFTDTKLEMVLYDDKNEKRETIAPGTSAKRIKSSDANVWSHRTHKKRQGIPFVLNAKPNEGTTRRIKGGVIAPDAESTQMNFVVPHPKQKNAFLLVSMKYSDVKAEDTAPPGEIPPQH